MRIKDFLPMNQPQEKLLRYGVEKLATYELLSVILGSGTKELNAVELSKKILKELKDEEFENISLADLLEFRGIGITKACRVIAAFELGKRLVNHKQTSFIMKPKDVWNELADIRESKKEHFILFYLDVKNQIIKKEIISIGILNASLVHPREVFEPAIKHLAGQIIISHNHPSGDCMPSEEDFELTKRLVKAGEILGIEVIDHVIISSHRYYSFKEHTLL